MFTFVWSFLQWAKIQKKKLHLQITFFTHKLLFQIIYCIILLFLAHCAIMLVLGGKRPFFWMSRSHVDYSQRWWPQDNLDLPTICIYKYEKQGKDWQKIIWNSHSFTFCTEIFKKLFVLYEFQKKVNLMGFSKIS